LVPKMPSQEEAIWIIEGIEENEGSLRRLVEQLETPLGVIPFVGAGLSIPFGFPGWKDFLVSQGGRAGIEDQIRKRIEDGDYEGAAEYLLKGLGNRAFHDAIDDAFGDRKLEGKQLDGAVAILPSLALGPVITTNFDHVLERAFQEGSCPFEYAAWGAKADMVLEAFYQNQRFLLKIHGDVKDRTDRILTLSEYQKHYGPPDAFDPSLSLPRLLKLMLESRPLLFVGCSLGADRTLAILKRISEELPGIAHYALVEKPSSDEEFRKKARHLSDHCIRPIWYPEGRHELIEPLLAYLADQIPPQFRPAQQRATKNRPLAGIGDPLLVHGKGFYGRTKEVKEVIAALEGGESLATVTPALEVLNVEGGPGIGKTEVCKEALRCYLTAHENQRAYYVELVEAADEAGFLTRLAEAFGISQATSREQILDAASAGPGIVYLDNLEDVIADNAAIELLKSLAEIPGVRVLASSRETLPGVAHNIPIRRLDLQAAVELFLEQWRRSGATADLPESPEVREFVENDLDRHPLSIVLVAAQGYQFNSLAGLRDAWRKESVRLARLPRGREDRLSSLEVSISHSFQAAGRESPEATLLWGLMGMFPEGMSPSAWRMLFSEEPEKAAGAREALLRLNILDVKSGGALEMLAPLRQFILDKARREEDGLSSQTLAEKSYTYFYQVASEADDQTFSLDHTATLDALLAEFPNIHHFFAFAGSLGGDWPRRLSDLSFHLLNYYQYRVLLGEDILQRLLPLQQPAGLTLQAAQSAEFLGDLESRLGKLDEAETHYKEAIELFRREQDNLGLANTCRSMGDLESRLGKPDEAETHYKEAMELYRQERSNLGLANAIQSLGDLESRLGKPDEAEAHYKEAMELYRQERSNLGLANAIRSLGDLERHLGKLDEAETHYKEAMELYRQERFNLGLSNAIRSLGDLESRLGKLDEAEAHYKEAIELYRQERANLGLAGAIHSLGDLESRLGKPDEAEAHYKEAMGLYRQERDNLGLANAIQSLGDLERHLGKPDEAEAHYKEAMELYRQERDNLGLANTCQSMGDLKRIRRDFEVARLWYVRARELYIAEREPMGLAYTCCKLALVLHMLGDSSGCDAFIEEAVTAAKASNVPAVSEYVQDMMRAIRPEKK